MEEKEVKKFIKLLYEVSIILKELFLYFDYLMKELDSIPDDKFRKSLESELVKYVDSIKRNIIYTMNVLEKRGVKWL